MSSQRALAHLPLAQVYRASAHPIVSERSEPGARPEWMQAHDLPTLTCVRGWRMLSLQASKAKLERMQLSIARAMAEQLPPIKPAEATRLSSVEQAASCAEKLVCEALIGRKDVSALNYELLGG
eukprot:54678-Amphidinium_carterae.1